MPNQRSGTRVFITLLQMSLIIQIRYSKALIHNPNPLIQNLFLSTLWKNFVIATRNKCRIEVESSRELLGLGP